MKPPSPPALRWSALAVVLALVPTPLGAQDEQAGPNEPGDPPPSPVVVAPSIEEFVEAEHPPEPFAEGRGATVELELTVLPDGSVAEVVVVGPAGDGFDEAALAAVQRFRFSPATRDGTPIPARIRYRYVFPEPVTVEEAAPELPTTGRLSGQIVTREDGVPIGGADVLVASADGTLERRVVAGEDGSFLLDGLPEGTYAVLVVANEFGEQSFTEEVVAGEETSLVYRFDTDGTVDDQAGFSATAVVEAPPREVTRRTIEAEELVRVPGTRGDALRAVELLPGVGRPPFGAGILIVRGAAPGDSQIFFEGSPVPLLYHFGGLTSFINSRLLDRIDFYPGNFSVRYGRATGGVLEVTGRDPALDGFHGVVDVNVIDASFLVEGPIGDNVSVAAAARRSYIDFFFENLVPDDAFDVLAAPVYYDYQTFLTWRPTDQDRVRFIVFGSSDEFRAVFPDPADGDPAFQGALTTETSFHRGLAAWRHDFSDTVYQDLSISYGVDFINFAFGEDLSFDGTFQNIQARAEWGWQVSEPLKLRAGMDIFASPFDIDFVGPVPGQAEGDQDTNLSGSALVNLDVSAVAYRPAAYVEADWRPIERLQLVGGLRADYARDITKWAFDPRLAAIYQLDDLWKLKGGVGLFSQPPDFNESADVEDIGNPDLEWSRSLHVSAGFERLIIPGIDVGVEGFFKYLWNRPVVPSNLASDEAFVSEGIGRIYGMELSGRWRPRATEEIPFSGFFSYTLMRSERKDGPDEPWRLFDFDQTHILTVSGTYEFGNGWTTGATFRLVSGNPTTPTNGGTYDVNTDLYSAIFGRQNSVRSSMFHRLDFRVEKQWEWARGGDLSPWKLALYLDIQNVYNRMNQEGFVDGFDYIERTQLNGLPIIPSLGLRGEL